MFVPPKNDTKKQYSCRWWAFLRTTIDSIDFKNENLTTKTRQKNHIFKKKNIP